MKRALLPLLLFLAFLGLYLLTLTDVHTYDALSYILDVDRKPWQELFHPHHLAYGPLGALIRAAAASFGWAGSVERLLQLANALAGAAGVALFGALVRRATGGDLAGVAAGLLLGASYAFWYYAVEVEVYTIAALLLIAALWLMLELARAPSLRLAALLGVAQGCAVLFHQTNVLLGVPALVALWAGTGGRGDGGTGGRGDGGTGGRGDGGRAVWALLAAYAVPLALIVGGAYLWVGLGVSGFRTPEALFGWAAGYTQTGYWGGAVDGAKLALLGRGLADTLAQPGGGLVGLGLLAALLLNLRGLASAPRGLAAVALSWLAVYGAFFLWWEPENIEFWIASLPPFYLLLVLACWGGGDGRAPSPPLARLPLSLARERGQGGEGHAARRVALPGLWPAVLLLTGVAMLVTNGVSIARRGDAGRDLQRVAAAELAARSAPGDLIVAPDGLLELYLPFYEDRANVFSLSQAMAIAGDWPAACALIQERVEVTLAGGYAVLVAADAIRPPPAPPGEPPTPAERLGLDPETVAACYEPLQPAFEGAAVGAGAARAERIPSAQELADGPGWEFGRGRWGWRAANAEPATDAQPGWAVRPLADPFLLSPPLQIDLGRVGAIELRMRAGTAARDAQLFFLDAAGQADEARSLRWELLPGGDAQTYTLPLGDLPPGDGVATGLRLDPVGVGDGGVVVVEWIRLLP